MKNEYLKAQGIIARAKADLQKLFDDISGNKTMEDQEAYATLDNVIGKLDSADYDFKYLNSPVKEGVLQEDRESGRYYIAYDDGTSGSNLTCGSSLELFSDDEWILGRVEARDQVYYFWGSGQPTLYRGMRVRKRIV